MRGLYFTLLSAALVACKHPLAIQGEGDISERLAGIRGCSLEEFLENSPQCTDNEVIAEAYRVSYEANPRDGWRFLGWQGTVCSLGVDRVEAGAGARSVEGGLCK